jgi:hypoxanthine phosphoribosyltransferase
MDISSFVPLFTREAIAAKVAEMGRRIAEDFRDEPLVCVCVLRGAFMFFADLVRAIPKEDLYVDFIRISSYGKSTVSSGHVSLHTDLTFDVEGKNVLVVEDVVDSGRSLRFLLDMLAARKPRHLACAVLVDKHARREVNVDPDYVGFSMDDGFIVGYGLDYAGKMRNLPEIRVPEQELR